MKKVGFVLFNYPLSSSISVINGISRLSAEGFDIEIFIDDRSIEQSGECTFNGNAKVNVISLSVRQSADVYPSALRRLYRRVTGSWSGRIVRPLMSAVAGMRFRSVKKSVSLKDADSMLRLYNGRACEFYRKVREKIDCDYLCLIGIDAPAFVIAGAVSASSSPKRKIPVIYWSMELLLKQDCHFLGQRILKHLETGFAKECLFAIIQDRNRAGLLTQETGVPGDKITLVPVSGARAKYTGKTDYLRQMLGIPSDKKILLYAGNIIEWSMCREIAKAAKSWGDGIVFVMHTWRKDLKDDLYYKEIADLIDNKKVFLSMNPVEYDQLPGLLSSADIGIMLYRDLGANFSEIGHASNKIVDYLNVGLPVIATDFPSLRRIVDVYRCGVCVKGPDGIKTGAEKILSDYSTFRTNAYRCYDEEYDFNNYFDAVVKKIKDIDTTE